MCNVQRCRWCNLKNPVYMQYHDREWGVPQYEDGTLFEFLILELFQAGLSWETILNKREDFRRALVIRWDTVYLIVKSRCLEAYPVLFTDFSIIRTFPANSLNGTVTMISIRVLPMQPVLGSSAHAQLTARSSV